MSVLMNRKNGTFVPDFIEDFFGVDQFIGTTPNHFSGFPNFNAFVHMPEANVIENAQDYQVELAAPGFDRKDFKVNIEDGVLNISAEKEQKYDDKEKNFRRREFSFSAFSRSFALPENIIGDKIDARYENGILKVAIPKKEITHKKPVKQITVA